jgi:hypothetical protein
MNVNPVYGFYGDEDWSLPADAFLISGGRPSSTSPGAPTQALIGKFDASTGSQWVHHLDGISSAYPYASMDGGCFVVRWFDEPPASGGGRNLYFASFSSTGTPHFQQSPTDDFTELYATPALRLANGHVLLTFRSNGLSGFSGWAGGVGALDESSGVVWNVQLQSGLITDIDGALQLSGGDLLLYGSTSTGGGELEEILLVRLSSTGAIQWAKKIGGPVDYDLGRVLQMSDGSLILQALVGDGSWGDRTWIARLNENGLIPWQHEILLDGTTYPYVNIYTGTGSQTLVVGKGLGGGEVNASHDIWSVVFGENGSTMSQTQWANSLDTSYPYANEQENGGFITSVPITNTSGNGGLDILLAKWGPDLTFEWSRLYGGSGDESYSYAQVTDAGEILLSGATNSFDALGVDPFVLGLDSSGQTTQTCWMSSIVPDNSLPISPGSAVVTSVSLTTSSLSFTPINLLLPTQNQVNDAFHSLSSQAADLTVTCGN